MKTRVSSDFGNVFIEKLCFAFVVGLTIHLAEEVMGVGAGTGADIGVGTDANTSAGISTCISADTSTSASVATFLSLFSLF